MSSKTPLSRQITSLRTLLDIIKNKRHVKRPEIEYLEVGLLDAIETLEFVERNQATIKEALSKKS